MLGIQLIRGHSVSLSRQLFMALQKAIVTGGFVANEPLPATRVLAQELHLSRNTVSEAYAMLATEGYIINRPGAASRVASGLNLIKDNCKEVIPTSVAHSPIKKPWLADFKTGQPDLTVFPKMLWGRYLREAMGDLALDQLGYSGGKGTVYLCQEIAHWLLRSRGLIVNPQDIMICSGTTQALHLLTDILHRPDQDFAIEHPAHQGITTMLRNKNYGSISVPVDASGIRAAVLEGRKIAACYITPSHQFPLGYVLSADRRSQLMGLARTQNFYILEDDYDSEYRYSGAPISPVYALAPERVIYIGSFSKTLFPALRLGFVVLPQTLQQSWLHYRTYMDVQNPIVEQWALARFLHKRKMDRHVRQMRTLYATKRAHLLEAIGKVFGSNARIVGDAAGLHLVLQLAGYDFSGDFSERARAGAIRVTPLVAYCEDPVGYEDQLLLGYGHLSLAQISAGIVALHQFLK